MFDEPVNGLDTDGIRWVRQLLRQLASEGRSVFVSSHLMSEMALTANEVVIIGRGRLVAQVPIGDLLAQRGHVRVRSPQAGELGLLLERAGATVERKPDGSLTVLVTDPAAIGDLALAAGLALHELSPQTASLEEAYMELVKEDVEFVGGSV